MIRFEVFGVPQPQGSKSAFVVRDKNSGKPKAVMREGSSKESNARFKAWRKDIADVVRAWLAEHPGPPIAAPVAVGVVFRFPPVASDPHRSYHTVQPDLDKLMRAVGDALKDAKLLKDDAVIAVWRNPTKRYTLPHERPGATITVAYLGDEEAQLRAQRKAMGAGR